MSALRSTGTNYVFDGVLPVSAHKLGGMVSDTTSFDKTAISSPYATDSAVTSIDLRNVQKPACNHA